MTIAVFVIFFLFIGTAVISGASRFDERTEQHLAIISFPSEINQRTGHYQDVISSASERGEILDQNQDILYPSEGFIIESDQTLAQSFKPSMTPLIKVDLVIARFSTTTMPLIVSIREDLEGNNLTSITIPAEEIPSWPVSWYSIDFPDIPVIPEKTYYIVVSYPFGINGYAIAGHDDVYPRGSAWISHESQNWIKMEDYDLAFKTYSERLPPDTPTIYGPTKGKPGNSYLFTFTTIDPEADIVYYYIDWGDGKVSEWIGPYHSGATASATHKWVEKGTYTIQVKAKDIYGNESDWGALSVTMPYSYNISFQPFLEKLLERFPNMFPVLRHFAGY